MSGSRTTFGPAGTMCARDIDERFVILRVVQDTEGWQVLWRQDWLERAKADDRVLLRLYRIADSVRDALPRMLGVQ